MLKITNNEMDFCFILDNLRFEDLQEVKAIWRDEWKEKTLESLKNTDVLILYGVDGDGNSCPISMGGFYELEDSGLKIACVWLLSTDFIKYNKTIFLKTMRDQLIQAETKYEIMYNYIYKSNFQAKGWLKRFGFCFDNPKPIGLNVRSDFEFFYKTVNRKEYKCV